MAFDHSSPRFTIFHGTQRVLQADRLAVLRYLQNHAELHPDSEDTHPLQVLEDATGRLQQLDWHSELALYTATGEITASNPEATRTASSRNNASRGTRAVGRPKLGVVSREVTLLPGHWEWLNHQPGGASAALRRLIDEARDTSAAPDTQRAAIEATYNAMQTLASDQPGYDEACRALFAGKSNVFQLQTQSWPDDVQAYLHQLSRNAWHH